MKRSSLKRSSSRGGWVLMTVTGAVLLALTSYRVAANTAVAGGTAYDSSGNVIGPDSPYSGGSYPAGIVGVVYNPDGGNYPPSRSHADRNRLH